MEAIKNYSFGLAKWSATAALAIVGFALGSVAIGWVAFHFLVYLVQS